MTMSRALDAKRMARDDSKSLICLSSGIILNQAWHRADFRFSVCNQMKVFFWILHSVLCKCLGVSEEQTTSIFR